MAADNYYPGGILKNPLTSPCWARDEGPGSRHCGINVSRIRGSKIPQKVEQGSKRLTT